MDENKKKPVASVDRKRLVILILFVLVLFSLLLIQFYRIQILEGEKWIQEAHKQHFFIVKEPFLRGNFFSNTSIKRGHPETPLKLVSDIQKYHLLIDPASIPPTFKKEIANQLISILNIPSIEKSKFKSNFSRKSRSRKLAMWLDPEDKDTIIQWWIPYSRKNHIARNALFFVSDYQRSYPFGKLLGQVLHTIQNNKEEETNQALPTGGLELSCDKYLKGKQGKRRLMRSPLNSLETGEVISNPENGADIYLTINHCLQAIVEEEIAKGVKACKAKGGWAAMMDPRTGEILALAQYPYFYPPDYQLFFNDPKMIEHTRVKAVTDANEPGSVMKPFTIALALKANDELREKGEKEIFDPNEMMDTSNSRFPGRSKPLVDTHFHHYLNMDMALQKSANIYMARLVQRIIERLGNGWYRQALEEVLGFGVKTGLEVPSETKGLLPTPGKKHPNGALEWSTPTPFSMAMGYNLQANSIQILRAYAVIANGGYLVQPTLIRKIIKTKADKTEEILLDNTSPERIQNFPHVLNADIIAKVLNAMKYVTKPGGTARRGEIWGYTEVGKTSTAKKNANGVYSETAYSANFVGFTPIENPAFILIVTMDEPEYGYIPGIGKLHHGGTCCAPVFNEISKRSLEYLGIAPDDPYGYPRGDPRYDSEKAHWIPETRRLQEKYEKWNNKTIKH
jgi:cell division protein FtsI (penicillin-binding protein 3)